MTKICTICKEKKNLHRFYKSKSSKDGRGYRCKDCDNKAVAGYREKHANRYKRLNRRNNRKSKYNLSHDDFTKMLREQNHSCKICGQVVTEYHNRSNQNNMLVIDHCHKTNKVRGLLCHKCNRGLGHFEDSPVMMLKAYRYLKNSN